jgi:hypothetical protein
MALDPVHPVYPVEKRFLPVSVTGRGIPLPDNPLFFGFSGSAAAKRPF